MMNHLIHTIFKHKSLIALLSPSLFFLCCILFASNSLAGNRFSSNYPCSDQGRECTGGGGTRKIDGFDIYKPCWEYSYTKTCNYPSRNDCHRYSHCYIVKELPCGLRDNYGNCVNIKKEFSCESWKPVTMHKDAVSTSHSEKEGKEKLVCKGVPCIDGNCFDKSYEMDADMMDSVSKLHAVSRAKGANDLNFRIFEGFSQHCSKKITEYTNCCSVSLKGWGKHLGAKCTKDEVDLIDKRQKNLCVHVGNTKSQVAGVTTVVKHKYCCFGTILNRIIQEQGRSQLGIGWGSPDHPDCRGLTIQQIMQLDFNKMDFSDFFADVKRRMNIPQASDIQARTKAGIPDIRKYDGNPNNKDNKFAGVNKNIKDDSWEAQEEERIRLERLEQERIERERIEVERRQKIALEEERKKREAEKLRQEKLRLEKLERERLERQRLDRIALEAKRQKDLADARERERKVRLAQEEAMQKEARRKWEQKQQLESGYRNQLQHLESSYEQARANHTSYTNPNYAAKAIKDQIRALKEQARSQEIYLQSKY